MGNKKASAKEDVRGKRHSSGEMFLYKFNSNAIRNEISFEITNALFNGY